VIDTCVPHLKVCVPLRWCSGGVEADGCAARVPLTGREGLARWPRRQGTSEVALLLAAQPPLAETWSLVAPGRHCCSSQPAHIGAVSSQLTRPMRGIRQRRTASHDMQADG